MSTNKQRRQAAQRHLQRSWSAAPSRPRSAAATCGIVATAVAVLVVVGAALLLTGVFSGDDAEAAADPTAEPPTAGGGDQRRRHGQLHLHPRRVGQPEPHRRRHAAGPGGDPGQGHQHAADEHRRRAT